jgi:hypothetical protein
MSIIASQVHICRMLHTLYESDIKLISYWVCSFLAIKILSC